LSAARDCLVELEQLAGASGTGRSEMLRRVTDLYVLTSSRQTDADREVFGQVMARLAGALEAEARMELAFRLSQTPKPPADLVRRLARDDIEIARPLLERSHALTDRDLIDIARSGSLAHSDAISRRAQLSIPITDLLMQHADDVMLAQMASNPRAELSHASLEHMAERAAHNPELKHVLLDRPNLSPEIASRLRSVLKVATGDIHDAEVRAERPDAPAAEVLGNELVQWNAAFAESGEIQGDDGDGDDDRRPAQRSGSAEAKLAALAQAGKVKETVEALSVMTGLSRAQVETCLLSAETPALVVLCRAHELASTTFSALLQLRLSTGAITTKGVASAMRRYETMDAGMAQRIMRFLKVRLTTPDSGAA